MVSEFQAGWLQDADQAWPRPADPSNTTLALNTLLQTGAHGVVNFPVQDTLNPAGWEAPWGNAFYSWDAALSVQLTHQGRWLPTYRFGELIHDYGPLLAKMHVKADAAIAYLTSAYDPAQITNDDVFAIAKGAMDAQHDCRAARITCALVDLRFAPLGDLQRYPAIIVPPGPRNLAFTRDVQQKLETYRGRGGRTVASAQAANILRPAAGGIPNAVLLVDPAERFGLLSIVNYGSRIVRLSPAVLHASSLRAVSPSLSVAPRDAALIPINMPPRAIPLAQFTPVPQTGERVTLRPGSWLAAKYPNDVYQDGLGSVVLENTWLRLIVSPCAGARALVWQDKGTGDNLFTTVGGLRDAWSSPLPPSARDYIGRYTHPIAAGTFNRCYAVQKAGGERAELRYWAPDAPPRGAVFEKSISVATRSETISIQYHVHFKAAANGLPQQITSFATGPDTRIVQMPNAYGLYDTATKRAVLVAWPHADIKAHTLALHERDALLTLTFSRNGTDKLRYGVTFAHSLRQAQAALAAFAKLPPLPTH
jgi:hypothetical protein